MSSTVEDLRAHNMQLQNYLSDWSRTQQELLESICMSSTSRQAKMCNSHHELADGFSTTDAPSILAANPANTAEASNPANSAEDAAILDALAAEGTTHNSKAPVDEERGGVAPNALDKCKRKLLSHFQVSLTTLGNLHRKEQVLSWMNETIMKLEDDLSNLDLLDIDEPLVEMVEGRESSILLHHISKKASPQNGGQVHKGICAKIRHLAGTVVRSHRFEVTTAIVIIFNAIVMGISTDHQIKDLDGEESRLLKGMEVVFYTYYTIELALRLIYSGKQFFISHEDRYWNWFDLLLVVTSTNDQVEPLYSSEGGSQALNLSFLRLARLLKMTKLLRMIRLMKMFKHLRLMLASIADSFLPICWAFLLVLIINYVSSILFVSLCTSFLQEAAEQNLEISSDLREGIDQYWGSVLMGMHSLVGATTGGDDWFNIGAPLMEIGSGCYCLLILYMAFFLIVVLNTFASLFVARVLEQEGADNNAVIAAEMQRKDEFVAKLQCLYDEIDDDGDGYITLDEFRKHAGDPRFLAWTSHLDIEITDEEKFFEVLSDGGTKDVDINAFVVGCIQLKGNAKEIDLMALFQLTKRIHRAMEECSLILHMKKKQDASILRQMKEIATSVNAANPYPMLANICRDQTELLALTSQLANSEEAFSHFAL